jgi:hypothetical protein
MRVSRLRRPRRGITVVALLVCLIVVTLITTAILRLSAAQREILRDEERRLQAEWLVESGVARSFARLAANREYTGETWQLSAVDLGLTREAQFKAGDHEPEAVAAVVTISVEREKDKLDHRRIHVQADYPRELPRRARHSKQISIDLEPAKPGVKP